MRLNQDDYEVEDTGTFGSFEVNRQGDQIFLILSDEEIEDVRVTVFDLESAERVGLALFHASQGVPK